MSWSISVVGNPGNVCDELDRHGDSLSGQCRVEFDAARPHLQALVRENFNRGAELPAPLIRLVAYGSGYVAQSSGEQLQRNCRVTIEPLGERLV